MPFVVSFDRALVFPRPLLYFFFFFNDTATTEISTLSLHDALPISDPYGLYSTRSTLDFKEGLLGHMLELFPFLGDVKILRQWAGMADMTPDFSPVMGLTPVENYYIDSGWGTWGFKATPVCGKRMAETVATGQPPDILAPFRLDRFRDFNQVGEKGDASC